MEGWKCILHCLRWLHKIVQKQYIRLNYKKLTDVFLIKRTQSVWWLSFGTNKTPGRNFPMKATECTASCCYWDIFSSPKGLPSVSTLGASVLPSLLLLLPLYFPWSNVASQDLALQVLFKSWPVTFVSWRHLKSSISKTCLLFLRIRSGYKNIYLSCGVPHSSRRMHF